MWTQEQKRECERKWRKDNPEKVKAKTKKWRAANKEKINAQKRAWNARNRDKINEARRNRASTPEYKAKRAEWHKNYNPTKKQKQRWTIKSREHARQRKIKAIELLGGVCSTCGLKDDPVVYDFHHRDPTEKDISVGQAKSWAKIESEIQKCDLVCANCHRKIHKV